MSANGSTAPTGTTAWATPLGRVAAPLREQVLAMLRKAILDFDLRPGQRLIERELIEQIGVSRTTIREVLRELTSEGLVTMVPQKGAIVAKPSPDEAADLYEARVALETLVVQRFVERATEAHVAELTTRVEDFAAVVEQGGDIHAMLAAKDRFYDILTDGAGSQVLQQILSGLQARVRVLRATSLSAPGRPQQAVAEIRELGAAIANRDATTAARICAGHVRSAATTGLVTLEERSAH